MDGFWGQQGNPTTTEEQRHDTSRTRTVLKDGEERTVIGGSSVQEHREGSVGFTEQEENLLMAADGVITTTNPQDNRYPYIAGKDYLGNLVSAGNLHRCMEKGCGRMVSNLSGVECEPGVWRCTKHYRLYDLCEFLKIILSPFFNFKNAEKPKLPIPPSQGDGNVPKTISTTKND